MPLLWGGWHPCNSTGLKRCVGPVVGDCDGERFSSPKTEASAQTEVTVSWANHPAYRRRFLALTAPCFASSGFGKLRGKGSPEGRFKGVGQKQRRAAAPASGSTMNSHKIEAPYCIERTCAAWIKKGTSVCGEQYITAVSGEDTKTYSRRILDAYSCRFALFESIAG